MSSNPNFLNLFPSVLQCLTTSRIKTVRAGERDCPQDNRLSKRAQSFDSRTI